MIGRGFDDIPIDTQSWPTVTTIVQPITQMVKRATLSLCDIVSVTNTSPQDDVEELPSRLIHRKSTAEAFVVYK
jgi:DNA-binding LacI/PurR family transcriptional regulator